MEMGKTIECNIPLVSFCASHCCVNFWAGRNAIPSAALALAPSHPFSNLFAHRACSVPLLLKREENFLYPFVCAYAKANNFAIMIRLEIYSFDRFHFSRFSLHFGVEINFPEERLNEGRSSVV